MFTLFRLVLLNLVWLCMSITAFVKVFGWESLVVITVWGVLEMMLYYVPVIQHAILREHVDG